jgi:protocatechuate 3,4-dioxygenase beta subunit
MLRTTVSLALLLLSSVLRASPQATEPSDEKGVVEGIVVNVQNSRGVPWARVTLRAVGQGGGARSIRAEGDGRFVFQQVQPGNYRVSATRPGFYTSVRPGAGSPLIGVAAGQHIKDIFVRLLPTVAVFGQIVDEHSDPLQDVSVRVLARDFRAGHVVLTQAGKATTDDHGDYRVFGLRPGNYYLVADYRPARKSETVTVEVSSAAVSVRSAPPPRGRATAQSGDGSVETAIDLRGVNQAPAEPAEETNFAYAPTFYPDTSDFQRAQVLTTHPGDEIHANFVMFTMPNVSIKGKVVNGLTGAPAGSAEVVASWTEYIVGDGVSVGTDPATGRFEIRDLAPGVYTLRTTFTEQGETYTDHRSFEVGIHGIENVLLAGMPDSIVTGHVIAEGTPGNARSAPFRVVVSFNDPGNPSTIRAATQGVKMEFATQLHPGDHYAVSALGLPQDYFLRAVRVSGHEVERDDVVIGSRHADLELVVSPGGGHVDGVVVDVKDQLRAGLVALFPDDHPITAESVRRVRADSKGRFSLSGLLPGTYKLFAFEDIDLDELISQPELLKQYGGENIVASESGHYFVQLRLIPADNH